jgi:hypothetical protein
MIEKVAAQIHIHWMEWARELIKSEPNISKERKERWEQECFMDFESLSEEMKELDRKFAREIIKIIENEKSNIK